MVSLKNIVSAIAVLAIPALCQSTPDQIVSNLNVLTQRSQALQTPGQQNSFTSVPFSFVGHGPQAQVEIGLSEMTTLINTFTNQMQGIAIIVDLNADQVLNAYREFGRAHSALQTTIAGQAGPFNRFGFTGRRMVAVLRRLQIALNEQNFSLQEILPGDGPQIRDIGNGMSLAVSNSVNAYNGGAGAGFGGFGFPIPKREVLV